MICPYYYIHNVLYSSGTTNVRIGKVLLYINTQDRVQDFVSSLYLEVILSIFIPCDWHVRKCSVIHVDIEHNYTHNVSRHTTSIRCKCIRFGTCVRVKMPLGL